MKISGLILAAILSLSVMSSEGNTWLAPDWELESVAGETVRLSDEVQEQPVILLFWASWCPYCKVLMPHLQSLQLEHGNDIKILAINFADKDGDPVAYIKDAGYDFTVLLEGDAVASTYEIYGTPGVLLVDRNREVRFDLRNVQLPEADRLDDTADHKRKAANRAPFWAAEIRKSVDEVLARQAP
jgi:cytochrome c biogenesis protein CcmG/thiol:disulfide interchange protein DsbE